MLFRLFFSGHWVDFLSLYKLRTDLDRARVLFDCVLRREKVSHAVQLDTLPPGAPVIYFSFFLPQGIDVFDYL